MEFNFVQLKGHVLFQGETMTTSNRPILHYRFPLAYLLLENISMVTDVALGLFV